jgi:hypothetical protein
MPAENVLVPTPVAAASRPTSTAVKPIPVGGFSPPIGETKILSMGHTRSSQLNHVDAEKLHFLPSATKLRSRLIAAAFFTSAVLVPYAGVKSASVYNNWQAERQAEALRVKAEADAKAAQEVAAAQQAAAQLVEAQRRELAEKAPRILAGFVDKGIADTNLPATPAAQLLSPESVKMWADAFWAIDRGTTPDFAQQLKADGAWAKPVQFATIMDHTILLTAVVDDNGTRKVWVAVMQDTSGRGDGAPSVINSVTSIPGVDPSKLYVAPNYARLGFDQIRGAFTTSLTK